MSESLVKKIFATTHRPWELYDYGSGETKPTYVLPAGAYELERKPYPGGYGSDILVVTGTLYGMSEKAWRQWKEDRGFESLVIEITEA